MLTHKQAIILIGFKHVGKSVIGKALAAKLQRSFVDLDEKIVAEWLMQQDEVISCRQLMQKKGAAFFLAFEHQVLSQHIDTENVVISLGGGTAVHQENQALLSQHFIIHVTAPRDVVFERILAQQERPAFLPSAGDRYHHLYQLWRKRKKIYRELATMVVNNDDTVAVAVADILQQLSGFLAVQ